MLNFIFASAKNYLKSMVSTVVKTSGIVCCRSLQLEYAYKACQSWTPFVI
ncbi:hypothetical protein [Candidatus Enterovibrio escicola]|nr:hypothetical protein [Candidatus Enterovibrio escacola]